MDNFDRRPDLPEPSAPYRSSESSAVAPDSDSAYKSFQPYPTPPDVKVPPEPPSTPDDNEHVPKNDGDNPQDNENSNTGVEATRTDNGDSSGSTGKPQADNVEIADTASSKKSTKEDPVTEVTDTIAASPDGDDEEGRQGSGENADGGDETRGEAATPGEASGPPNKKPPKPPKGPGAADGDDRGEDPDKGDGDGKPKGSDLPHQRDSSGTEPDVTSSRNPTPSDGIPNPRVTLEGKNRNVRPPEQLAQEQEIDDLSPPSFGDGPTDNTLSPLDTDSASVEPPRTPSTDNDTTNGPNGSDAAPGLPADPTQQPSETPAHDAKTDGQRRFEHNFQRLIEAANERVEAARNSGDERAQQEAQKDLEQLQQEAANLSINHTLSSIEETQTSPGDSPDDPNQGVEGSDVDLDTLQQILDNVYGKDAVSVNPDTGEVVSPNDPEEPANPTVDQTIDQAHGSDLHPDDETNPEDLLITEAENILSDEERLYDAGLAAFKLAFLEAENAARNSGYSEFSDDTLMRDLAQKFQDARNEFISYLVSGKADPRQELDLTLNLNETRAEFVRFRNATNYLRKVMKESAGGVESTAFERLAADLQASEAGLGFQSTLRPGEIRAYDVSTETWSDNLNSEDSAVETRVQNTAVIARLGDSGETDLTTFYTGGSDILAFFYNRNTNEAAALQVQEYAGNADDMPNEEPLDRRAAHLMQLIFDQCPALRNHGTTISIFYNPTLYPDKTLSASKLFGHAGIPQGITYTEFHGHTTPKGKPLDVSISVDTRGNTTIKDKDGKECYTDKGRRDEK